MKITSKKFFLFFLFFPLSAVAMELKKFDKPIGQVFNEAAMFILSIAGGLGILLLIFGGLFYIISGTNPDNQNKAKKVISFSVFGIIIVLVSYAILVAMEKIAS